MSHNLDIIGIVLDLQCSLFYTLGLIKKYTVTANKFKIKKLYITVCKRTIFLFKQTI